MSRSADEMRALAAKHCRPNAPKLKGAKLAARLSALPGWTAAGDRIGKTFRFADYYRTMAFVNAVASIAHQMDRQLAAATPDEWSH